MSVATFNESDLARVKELQEIPIVLNRIFKQVLQLNTDFGAIPGTSKPSLWKPGAELLAKFFDLNGATPIIEKTEDLQTPYFSYTVTQPFFNKYKIQIATGVGACNSAETKYALILIWQLDYEKMNEEEKSKIIIRITKDGKKYYRKRAPDEVFAIQNTILKMAAKRAFVDGVLKATGADRIFTQDVDEDNEEEKIKNARAVNPLTPK